MFTKAGKHFLFGRRKRKKKKIGQELTYFLRKLAVETRTYVGRVSKHSPLSNEEFGSQIYHFRSSDTEFSRIRTQYSNIERIEKG